MSLHSIFERSSVWKEQGRGLHCDTAWSTIVLCAALLYSRQSTQHHDLHFIAPDDAKSSNYVAKATQSAEMSAIGFVGFQFLMEQHGDIYGSKQTIFMSISVGEFKMPARANCSASQ